MSAAYRHWRRGFGTGDPREGGAIEGLIRQSTLRARRGLETHIASLDGPEASWVLDYPVKTFGLGAGIPNSAVRHGNAMVSPGFAGCQFREIPGHPWPPHRWALLGPMTGFSPVVQYSVELRSLN